MRHLLSIILLATICLFIRSCSIHNNTTVKQTDNSSQNTVALYPSGDIISPEIRGAWIASVCNIDFPSAPDLSIEALKKELDTIIESAERLKLNTLLFQVHPSADALYKSDLFPVSRYLSSERTLYFDPLEYLISRCHTNEINLYAWINPFRVTVNKHIDKSEALTEIDTLTGAGKTPDLLIFYDGQLYYDPGNPSVKEIITSCIEEIVSRYKVDGIVFDDYFYPYPNGYESFDDSLSFVEYSTGETLEEWRRNNINGIIKECFDTVKRIDRSIRFGVAPFGIWKNGNGGRSGSLTNGLEAYSSLYCDALAWVDGGYVDFISPQLYWNDEKASSFKALYRWWNDILDGTGVDYIPSLGTYRYENDWIDHEEIITDQIRSLRQTNCYHGAFYYGLNELINNTNGAAEEIIKLNDDEHEICNARKYPYDLRNEYPITGTVFEIAH